MAKEILLPEIELTQESASVQIPSLKLSVGKPLFICGLSGTGKTNLGKLLAGELDYNIPQLASLIRHMVHQQDNFIALSGLRSSYNGQRYENQGMENCPTLLAYLKSFGADNDDELKRIVQSLSIEHILQSKLLQLSNGERKRSQLAAALLQKADLLVLDKPFVGLDVSARENLLQILKEISSKLFLVLISEPEKEQWSHADVLKLRHGKADIPVSIQDYCKEEEDLLLPELDQEIMSKLPNERPNYEQVVSMRKLNVSIGGKSILKNIDWQVKSGEHWALLGYNGAGKSTLLSLITADNPQGYINDLVLFDRKRGTGESIWDIKQKIGYVSPELHQYFLRGKGIANTIPGMSMAANHDGLTCVELVASGFRDEIGFSSTSVLQNAQATDWLRLLGIEHMADKKYTSLSMGQQRLLLLARALVKAPALLLLDEPCQGLDPMQKKLFMHVLNKLSTTVQSSMIYVTHHREEIPSSVSKLIELKDGEVHYCGSFNKK